jgi:thiol-disulfide isomerase/thioredoxin
MSKNNITIIDSINELNELKVILSNPDINHVLWFGSKWCAPCRRTESFLNDIIQLNGAKTKPINIYKINIDDIDIDNFGPTDDCEIKVLTRIEKLPTLLYFKDGSEQPIKRFIGCDKDNLIEFLSSIDELKSTLSESTDF